MNALAGRDLFARALDVAALATTPRRPSDYLALVRPLRAGRARIEALRDETSDARTIVLAPARGWKGHRAGQFATVGAEIDGRIVTRTYSIASSPLRGDGRVEITVKRVAGGAMSTHLTRDAKVGDLVRLGDARGDFVAPEREDARPLFVTAGSGVTPVMSMLRTFALRGAMPDVAHVHYSPRPFDVIFGAELAELASRFPRYRFTLVSTRTGAKDPRFSRGQLDALVPDWRAREAWACGPAAMLDAIEGAFAREGRAEKLHVERFRARLAPPWQPRRTRRLRALRSEPRRGRSARRRDAAVGRRRVRPSPEVGVPHGHLPLVRRHARRGLGPRPSQRRAR